MTNTQRLRRLLGLVCFALAALGIGLPSAMADSPVWHGVSSIEGIETGRGRVQIYLPGATSTHLCPNTASNKWFEIDMSEPGAEDMLKTAYKAAELGWSVKVRSDAPTCFNGYIRVDIIQMLAP